MRTLVVYESMFGNTAAVAAAVGRGLAGHTDVEVVPVDAAPRVIDAEVGLLVVGGPTHAFGLTRAGTRRSAVERGATSTTSVTTGLREWLGEMRPRSTTTLVAAFDTKMHSRFAGSAAHGALRRLRRLGLHPAAPAESFIVGDSAGPLADGELARAEAWGGALAAKLPARAR